MAFKEYSKNYELHGCGTEEDLWRVEVAAISLGVGRTG